MAAMLTLAAIGARQAEEGTRPLGFLDGPFEFLRTSAVTLMPWLDANAASVAGGVSFATLGLVLVAWASAGRRALPIAWFVLCLAAASWGQVSVLAERWWQGVGLYGLAAAGALVLGVRCPLAGGERWRRYGCSVAAAPATAIEYAGVAVLVVAAFVTRVYALNELPENFENEMMLAMLASHTLAGIKAYAPWGMLSNTNGFLHMLLQLPTFEVFGTSVYSLRLTSALWWTLSLPLFYWLLRRLGGVGAAVIGTVLLASAPEQLFWSRCETVCVALLTPLAVATVALGVRLIEQPRPWVLLALLLWMPLTRYGYVPVVVLPIFVIVLYCHSLLFVRGAWRTALRVVPVLALGMALWSGSLTTAYAVFTGGEWVFVNPAVSGGAPVWRGEGQWRHEGAAELIVNHVRNTGENLRAVAERATYRAVFDNWYRRSDLSEHPTVMNAALPVLGAVALGYLLGQARDPRAFAVLAWIGLGLLPAVLSQDPAARRMALAFPGFYAAIALALAGVLEMFRERTGFLSTLAARCGAGVGVAAVAWTSMGSHFAMPMAPTYVDQTYRASRGVFDSSDAVFHTLAPVWSEILSFVHGDEILKDERVPCLARIGRGEFLKIALRQECDYEEPSFVYTLSPPHREALRQAYDPRAVGFLIGEGPHDEALRELARALFPGARASYLHVPRTSFNVLWLEVGPAELKAIRTPVLLADLPQGERTGAARELLAGVELKAVEAPGLAGLTVRAGLLIEEDGWYGFGLEPGCPAARLRIGDRDHPALSLAPFTKGVYDLSLMLPGASACARPLRLVSLRATGAAATSAGAPVLLSPETAAVPLARGRPLVTLPGYAESRLPFAPPTAVVDVGVDRHGTLYILGQEGDGLLLAKVSAGGVEQRRRIAGAPPKGMSVAPDGTLFLVYDGRVTVHDSDGELRAAWNEPLVRTPALGHLADGGVLSAVIEQHAIAVLDRGGRLRQKWNRFEGGPGGFNEPGSVAVTSRGDILVLQLDGTALLFRSPPDRFDPRYVRSFTVDFSHESVLATGWALDDEGRVIVPEPGRANILTYQLDGSRVMAAAPELDLSKLIAEQVSRVVATREGIYTLDLSRRLHRFVHVAEKAEG